MKFLFILGLSIILIQASCKKSATDSQENNGNESSIKILSLSPAAESVVTSSDTIFAELAYVIADGLESPFGFTVSIKFQSVNENQTLSLGAEASVSVSGNKGQATLIYPLSSAWRSSDLAHPVSCFFYLHQYLSETTSTVLAKTERINYNE